MPPTLIIVSTAQGLTGRLLEREQERARVSGLLERSAVGAGGLLVFEGPAGIGKTQLMIAARGMARSAGFVVASASGSELEQDFAYGAVRQLLERHVQDDHFTGAAASAAPLFGRSPNPLQDNPGEVLHGLYWLTVALSAQAPLALLCDDAHWWDGPSLRFLSYLVRRCPELPLAVIVGTRPPGTGPEAEVLGRLVNDQQVQRQRPAPLSDRAVAELVRRWLDDDPAPAFCEAVARASRGNPFLISELVRASRDAGVSPDARGARRLSKITADSAVMGRVGQLPEGALAVARAVAVLGADAHLRHVAALCDLDPDTAGKLADVLFKAEIIGPQRPLTFTHPLVGWSVHQEILPGERSRMHRRAAALLSAENTGPDRVARHHLLTEPAADPDVVTVLMEAASSALRQGATDIAVAQLRRALEEPPAPARRLEVLLELSAAEEFLLDPVAADHLAEALLSMTDPRQILTLTTARAITLCVAGRAAEAVAAIRDLAPVVGDDPDLQRYLMAASTFVGATGPEAFGFVQDDVGRLLADHPLDSHRAPPGILGMRAWLGACRGESPDLVAALALRALQAVSLHDPLLPIWFHLALASLVMVDRDDEAAEIIERHLTAARRSGAPGPVSIALFLRALIELRAGDLDEARADALAALDTCQTYRIDYLLPGPMAILVDVHRERDELDKAQAVLTDNPHEVGRSLFDLFLLAARARLRGAQDRFDDAVQDFELGRELSRRSGIASPNLVAWDANIAFGLALSGRPGAALPIARRAVDVAHDLGSARVIAEAQRALGMAGERSGEDLSAAAIATFAKLGARLEECRGHLARATTVGIVGTPREVQENLEGLRLAERCGAIRLAAIARQRLRNLGTRPKVRPVTGLGALTAGERRVVLLAAEGLSNKDIAQQLFVTVKTVETHLAHSYQKLGITSRQGLRQVLSVVPR